MSASMTHEERHPCRNEKDDNRSGSTPSSGWKSSKSFLTKRTPRTTIVNATPSFRIVVRSSPERSL